jgi:hypothetical protein
MSDGFVINATSGKATITKDPQAVLDYTFDWSDWLEVGDTITAQTVTVHDGPDSVLVKNSSSITGSSDQVSCWLSGGTVGAKYTVTAHITTAGGRQDDRSFYVKIKEK